MSNANLEALTALLSAIKAEHDGEYFYSMAARLTADAKGRRVFESLARDERQHQEFLRAQYESLKSRGVIDPGATLGKPVELDRHNPIFSDDLTLRIGEAHHEMSALSVAMQLEQSSVAFYREQAGRAGHQQVQAFLLELAAWEQAHLEALTAQYQQVQGAYWDHAGLPR